MEKKPIVVGMGELLWDVLPTEKKAGGAVEKFSAICFFVILKSICL